MTTSNLIWLASYPKSGNTWFRILLANLRAGQSQPVDINGSLPRQISVLSRKSFDEMTMFASGLLEGREIDQLRPAVCAAVASECQASTWEKVHYAWSRTPSGEPVFGRNSARAAVYLVRDPRDVAVSYAHHLNQSIDATIDLLNSGDAVVCPSGTRQHPGIQGRLDNWSRHVISWLDQKDVPVQAVRYEDLLTDTAAAFAEALRFAGEEVDPHAVERAVSFSTFSELRRQEQSAGFCERSPAGSLFFRRGQSGSWREELSDAQAARIVREHGETMAWLGYLS
jgi:aryl sulfotransferase